MIYQSEDHFTHDRSWKNEIIDDLKSVAIAKNFPCTSAQKFITTHRFFYSFCCKEQFKNYHQFTSALLLYTNTLKEHLDDSLVEQPLVVFFDKNLNRFFKHNPKELIWDALGYAQQFDSGLSNNRKFNEMTDTKQTLFFNDLELCLNIIDSSAKYSRGVFDKNLMLILHLKKKNSPRIITMKKAS